MKIINKKEHLAIFIAILMLLSTILASNAYFVQIAAAGTSDEDTGGGGESSSGGGNQAPVAKITDSSGESHSYWHGNTNTFYGDRSYDPDGHIICHWWIIYDGDGKHTWTSNSPPSAKSYTHKYSSPSAGWLVVLGVQDDDCEITWTTTHVICSGTVPHFSIYKSGPSIAFAGETISYTLKVCNNQMIVDPNVVDDYDQSKITIIDAGGGVDDGDKITWSDQIIGSGKCKEYKITALINESLTDGTIIKNCGHVYSLNGKEYDRDCVETRIFDHDFTLEKKVRKEGTAEWVDNVNALVGDTIRFRLCIENDDDKPLKLSETYASYIFDLLPIGLEYNNNATLNGEPTEAVGLQEINNSVFHGTTISFHPTVLYPFDENLLGDKDYRYKIAHPYLEPGQKVVIEFDAIVKDCGVLTNSMRVYLGFEYKEYDKNKGWMTKTATYTAKDTATVTVSCDADIEVDKYVSLDGVDYYKEIDADVGDKIYFKIIAKNTGGIPVDIILTDELPLDLKYDNIADPEPDDAENPGDGTLHYIWHFNDIDPLESITITFEATVQECGHHTNYVKVNFIAYALVVDDDEATVNVQCPGEPCLEYTPEQYDFGCINECSIATTTFEIWNGCEGALEYEISWDCGWIQSLTPTSGTSTGEKDTITVQINTAGMWGTYSCNITITSNGGEGNFTLYVFVGNCDPNPDPDPDPDPTNLMPLADIKTPLDQKFYFNDKEFFSLGRTLIIGGITIKVDASDSDGYIQKVEFYIDDDLKETIDEGPYEYKWNEKIFGEYDIKVKVYDNEGSVREEVRNVLILNLALAVHL